MKVLISDYNQILEFLLSKVLARIMLAQKFNVRKNIKSLCAFIFFFQNYYVEVNRLLRIDNNLFEFVYIYEGMA